MALENKKSILQPSSVEAQRYRLQYSNVESQADRTNTSAGAIAPTQRAATSTANVSQFAPVPVPAPVVAPPAPTPPAAVEIPVEYKQALYFDGTTALSASLDGGHDLDFLSNSTDYLVFTLLFKPATMSNTNSTKQTILHMYSGSADTQSFEVYTQYGDIYVDLRPDNDPANAYTFKTSITWAKVYGRAYNLPNSYTFYQVRLKSGNYRDIKTGTQTAAGNSAANRSTSTRFSTHPSLDLTNTTDFYIGGSPANNTFFSGSIASIMFTNGTSMMTNQEWGDLAVRERALETITPQLRTYNFDNALTEHTGSQASYSLPLEIVTGTLTYVDGYVKR